MSRARTCDPSLAIPPVPRQAVPARPRRGWVEAVREASLAGMATLLASWGLAELALLLGGY
ncbi:hypothetical protein [Crenalkalicoccus roseus]|uniref:hypothetical protein n=1 Tax=Crenalkalicoccus roseus TaxID=1485588 RepID=UPI001081C67D|nr:hypothetical protein [Crenalkalicoccus roseus]